MLDCIILKLLIGWSNNSKPIESKKTYSIIVPALFKIGTLFFVRKKFLMNSIAAIPAIDGKRVTVLFANSGKSGIKYLK